MSAGKIASTIIGLTMVATQVFASTGTGTEILSPADEAYKAQPKPTPESESYAGETFYGCAELALEHLTEPDATQPDVWTYGEGFVARNGTSFEWGPDFVSVTGPESEIAANEYNSCIINPELAF